MVLASETLFALCELTSTLSDFLLSIFVRYPLFAFTPIKSGGLGVSEAAIGMHMAVRSVTNIAVMVFYTPLQRRLGTVRLYQFAMAIYPFAIAFMPLLNHIARQGEESTLLFNAVLLTFFFVWSLACLAWSKFFRRPATSRSTERSTFSGCEYARE